MQTVTNMKNQHAQKIAEELTHFLADTYALYLKTQNFHWNVTGPHFYSLHKMFEEQYQQLAEAVDEIAERIRALGSKVPASFSEFSKLTSIKEEGEANTAENMVKKLGKDHETLAQLAAMIIVKSQKAQDEATTDLLVQRQQEHDKTAWMLNSSLT